MSSIWRQHLWCDESFELIVWEGPGEEVKEKIMKNKTTKHATGRAGLIVWDGPPFGRGTQNLFRKFLEFFWKYCPSTVLGRPSFWDGPLFGRLSLRSSQGLWKCLPQANRPRTSVWSKCNAQPWRLCRRFGKVGAKATSVQDPIPFSVRIPTALLFGEQQQKKLTSERGVLGGG